MHRTFRIALLVVLAIVVVILRLCGVTWGLRNHSDAMFGIAMGILVVATVMSRRNRSATKSNDE